MHFYAETEKIVHHQVHNAERETKLLFRRESGDRIACQEQLAFDKKSKRLQVQRRTPLVLSCSSQNVATSGHGIFSVGPEFTLCHGNKRFSETFARKKGKQRAMKKEKNVFCPSHLQFAVDGKAAKASSVNMADFTPASKSFLGNVCINLVTIL